MTAVYKVTPLYALRRWQDLSPHKLGRASGVASLDIGAIEHGEREPTAQEAEALAGAFGVSVAALFPHLHGGLADDPDPQVERAVRDITAGAEARRELGIGDADDLAFWSDAYMEVETTDDGMRVRSGYQTTSRPPAAPPAPVVRVPRATPRPRGAGRPRGRRTASAAATARGPDDDSDPEPPKPKPPRPADLATEGRGRLICSSCGSKYRADAGTPEVCGPCERRRARKRTGKRGGAA